MRVEGLRATIRSLEKFGVETQDLKAAFKAIGNLVVREAHTLTPRKSGALVNSIRASNTKNKAIVRAGSARVPYAGVIHYGWPSHGISPQPYLHDAAERKQGEAIQLMDKELNDLIRRLDLKN